MAAGAWMLQADYKEFTKADEKHNLARVSTSESKTPVYAVLHRPEPEADEGDPARVRPRALEQAVVSVNLAKETDLDQAYATLSEDERDMLLVAEMDQNVMDDTLKRAHQGLAETKEVSFGISTFLDPATGLANAHIEKKLVFDRAAGIGRVELRLKKTGDLLTEIVVDAKSRTFVSYQAKTGLFNVCDLLPMGKTSKRTHHVPGAAQPDLKDYRPDAGGHGIGAKQIWLLSGERAAEGMSVQLIGTLTDELTGQRHTVSLSPKPINDGTKMLFVEGKLLDDFPPECNLLHAATIPRTRLGDKADALVQIMRFPGKGPLPLLLDALHMSHIMFLTHGPLKHGPHTLLSTEDKHAPPVSVDPHDGRDPEQVSLAILNVPRTARALPDCRWDATYVNGIPLKFFLRPEEKGGKEEKSVVPEFSSLIVTRDIKLFSKHVRGSSSHCDVGSFVSKMLLKASRQKSRHWPWFKKLTERLFVDCGNYLEAKTEDAQFKSKQRHHDSLLFNFYTSVMDIRFRETVYHEMPGAFVKSILDKFTEGDVAAWSERLKRVGVRPPPATQVRPDDLGPIIEWLQRETWQYGGDHDQLQEGVRIETKAMSAYMLSQILTSKYLDHRLRPLAAPTTKAKPDFGLFELSSNNKSTTDMFEALVTVLGNLVDFIRGSAIPLSKLIGGPPKSYSNFEILVLDDVDNECIMLPTPFCRAVPNKGFFLRYSGQLDTEAQKAQKVGEKKKPKEGESKKRKREEDDEDEVQQPPLKQIRISERGKAAAAAPPKETLPPPWLSRVLLEKSTQLLLSHELLTQCKKWRRDRTLSDEACLRSVVLSAMRLLEMPNLSADYMAIERTVGLIADYFSAQVLKSGKPSASTQVMWSSVLTDLIRVYPGFKLE